MRYLLTRSLLQDREQYGDDDSTSTPDAVVEQQLRFQSFMFQLFVVWVHSVTVGIVYLASREHSRPCTANSSKAV
jgi:hypothetical protein